MQKNKFKFLFALAVLELVFIIVLNVMLKIIPHFEHEFIYFVNINLIFLVSVLGWASFGYGASNRVLTAFISIWFTVFTAYTILFIFSRPNFSDTFNFINFHILYIFLTTYQLCLTFYLFFLSLFPHFKERKLVLIALFFGMVISIVNYSPIFILGTYETSYDPLFSKSYNLHLLNFSLLAIFWHQYTKMKIIFSEYLPNILSVYTIMIGLEIFHNFSSQNELLFHYFAQYFNFLLYLIITVLFIARVNYLIDPKSKENENYIKNYELLHDFMDKPRRGLIVEFYSHLNRNTALIVSSIILFLGVYLFFFNKFTVFLRLSVVLLIIATIISLLLAIMTWHKRWYQAIGIFFKKKVNK